jgi:hypothetical protein
MSIHMGVVTGRLGLIVAAAIVITLLKVHRRRAVPCDLPEPRWSRVRGSSRWIAPPSRSRR